MLFVIIGSIALTIQIVLYLAIACGAPCANLTLDGSQKTLPKSTRFAFLGSVCFQIFALFTLITCGGILQTVFPSEIHSVLAAFFALFFGFSAIKMACGPNSGEKKVFLPLTVTCIVGFLAALLL